MSGAAVDQVIFQSKSVSDGEFASFCESVTGALYTGSTTDCLSGLRQLFLLTHSDKRNRKIPQQLLDALVKILLVADKPKWEKLLCAAILQEVAPSSDINLPVGNLPWDDNQVPYVLTVALNQGIFDGEIIQSLVPQVVRWLSTVGYSFEVQARALTSLVIISRNYPQFLSKEQVHVVSSQMCEWLRRAGLQQSPNPYSRGIFRKDAEQQPLVAEMDGVITKKFFTALCIGQYYTQDQMLNMWSFSMLRTWLHQTSTLGYDPEVTSPASAMSSRASTPSLDSPEGSTTSRQANTLADATLQYALRIIDQCDRKPKVTQDADLQQACLLEAVYLLDQLCCKDSALIPKVFETVKRIYSKTLHTHPRCTLATLQFFLNHSEAVVYDALQLYESFLETVPSQYYSNPAVSFDAVMFILDNLEPLCLQTQLLTKYFPNILKLLAWNPSTYIAEFMEFLPTFLSPSTTLEVLHTLLDLPCLAASLELSHRASRSDSSPGGITAVAISSQAIENFNEPRYKPVFNFILRAQGGFGDTIDRLSRLHELLGKLSTHPRVLRCSEVVPVLLRVLFDTVLEEGDFSLASNLLSVILERSSLLYNIPLYQQEVRSLFSSHVLSLMKLYPRLIMEQNAEILDFLGSVRNIAHKEDFFIHIVWCVGEYMCSSYDVRCTPDSVSTMYEAIEILAYEVASNMQSATTHLPYSPRLLTTIMSTMAKLASRSQDIIPRVMLCLGKLGQVASVTHVDAVSRQAISDRAAELISLLKLPNVAAVVLSPPPEIESERWHLDNTSLPVVLQMTSSVLQNKTPSSYVIKDLT